MLGSASATGKKGSEGQRKDTLRYCSPQEAHTTLCGVRIAMRRGRCGAHLGAPPVPSQAEVLEAGEARDAGRQHVVPCRGLGRWGRLIDVHLPLPPACRPPVKSGLIPCGITVVSMLQAFFST